MARLTGFIFQDKYLDRLAKLSDQEVGRLVRALAMYHATGETQELKGRECGYYDFIKGDIDEIELAYQKKCENMKRPQLTAIAPNCDQLTADAPNININKNINTNKKTNRKESPLSGRSEKTETGETDRRFEKFWSVYPRHTGKQDAQKAFAKLKVDDALLEVMVNAIIRQKQCEQWQDQRFIPYPATWLNGKRWEDEPLKESPGKRVSAQMYEQREYNEEENERVLGVRDLFEMPEEEFRAKYGKTAS